MTSSEIAQSKADEIRRESESKSEEAKAEAEQKIAEFKAEAQQKAEESKTAAEAKAKEEAMTFDYTWNNDDGMPYHYKGKITDCGTEDGAITITFEVTNLTDTPITANSIATGDWEVSQDGKSLDRDWNKEIGQQGDSPSTLDDKLSKNKTSSNNKIYFSTKNDKSPVLVKIGNKTITLDIQGK